MSLKKSSWQSQPMDYGEDDRTDEEQIGATYEELEWAMAHSGNSDQLTDRQRKVLSIYSDFHNKNEHKMLPIPIFKNET